MIIPPFLKAGHQVGIISTARHIPDEKVQPAVAYLNKHGLKVQIGRSIGARENQFAGSDEIRRHDLQQMLDDPEVKAILCAKGGYGTVRIIDQINFEAFLNNPKWLAGYSDVTILHAHLNNHMATATIHSCMAGEIDEKGADATALKSLMNGLFGYLENLTFEGHPYNQNGHAKGVLMGGNLSIIYNLIGSNSDFKPEGKILFLEEVDEYLYHVDRMMWALKRAGKLDKLNGVIIGGMTNMNDNEVPFGKGAETIIHEHLSLLDVPLAFAFPAGHLKANHAFYLGREILLDVGKVHSKISLV
ncbi:MAG: LD-carboxypeptidase [Bacteroidetes bacterium SW_10_40_5]|nr:MAG: LD-carboxypeptidase [Bacteroidetes bacterium SW_10_40_5]